MSFSGASAPGVVVLALAALAVAGLSACHDGAGKHTETTQVRITGTPKAGYVAPARHEADKPAHEAPPVAGSPAAGSGARSGVGAEPIASQES